MLLRLLVASCFVSPLVGCGLSHRLATARHTPCDPGDVQILDRERVGKDEHWFAQCGGHRYECQALALEDSVHYRCRPLDAQ